MNYIDPVVASGNHGFASAVDVRFPNVNTSVSAIRDFAVTRGWTNPTVGGQPDGTNATANIAAVTPPFHTGFGGPSCIAFDNFIGIFDSVDYRFFDPHAIPPDADPTGNLDGSGFPIQGVACGTSIAGSLGAMTGALSASRWNFSLSTTPDPHDGFYHGTATAKNRGPSGNVDSFSPAGFWSPANQNIVVGPGPTRGGWNIYSTPAPLTGDQIKIWLFQAEFGNMRIQANLNGSQVNEYPLVSSKWNIAINPYQFTLQELPGQPRDPGDLAPTTGGGSFNLVAALSVPSEFGPQTINVSLVDSPGIGPVVVHTAAPHGLAIGDRIKIAGVLGTILVNGTWWVQNVGSSTTFSISPDRSTLLAGDGTTYISGGVITFGLFESMMATADGLNTGFTNSNHTFVKVNGVFKSSWTSPRNSLFFDGVTIPVVNIGTVADAITSAGKPLLQAPYVMLRTQDDNGVGTQGEARICGMLWDTFIQMQRKPLSTQATFSDRMHQVWFSDQTTLPLVNASLWIKSQSD